jgi:hypothetical protein
MNKVLLITIGIISTLLVSCSKDKMSKPKLNEEEFTMMLIDIHITDGTLSSQNIYRSGTNYRPSYYYNSIYEKYQIQPAEFDSCVAYYANNTQNFTKIYDRVIDSLNRLETKYRIDIKNARLEQDTVNLWNRKKHWKIPKDGRPNFRFSIPVDQKGIYTVSADIRILKNDQTENPRMEAYFWKKDTVNGPQKIPFDTKIIERDSMFQNYTIQLEYQDTNYTELRGNVFNWDNKSINFTQEYEIKNIIIFNPEIKPDTTEIEKEIERHLNKDGDYLHELK